MAMNLRKNGFTLVEALISLGLIAFISMLSMKLLQPPPRQNTFGRKAGDFIEHIVSMHRQVELSRGRAPLTPDLSTPTTPNSYIDFADDGNIATPPVELGFAVSLMQTETQANYCNSAANPECNTWAGQDFLDYPGGMRLYVRPEQFPWLSTQLQLPPFSITVANMNRNAVVPNPVNGLPTATANRYKIQSFFLLDMDPLTIPTALSNDDLLLLYVNNDSGTISTAAQEAINALRSTPPLPNGRATFTCSFYDVHKQFNACAAIGGQAVLGI
jgi:type II secretory pathway pseudopilin PulG